MNFPEINKHGPFGPRGRSFISRGGHTVVETANHTGGEDGEPNGGVRNFERELKRSSADVGADGGRAFRVET